MDEFKSKYSTTGDVSSEVSGLWPKLAEALSYIDGDDWFWDQDSRTFWRYRDGSMSIMTEGDAWRIAYLALAFTKNEEE